MEAIILAGGFGTRLRSVVKDVPKPMAPVAGRPFLSYLLDQAEKQGVIHAVLAVGYKWEVIKKYFGDQYKNISLSYSVETAPLLTGGALKKALKQCQEDTVAVLNGDTYFDVNLKEMIQLHQKKQASLSIAVKKMQDFSRYGTVIFNKNQIITRFDEKKPCQEGYINGGIYVVNRNLFAKFPLEKFMLEKDFMEKFVGNRKFAAYISDGYFIDIGIPEDYEKANKQFAENKLI